MKGQGRGTFYCQGKSKNLRILLIHLIFIPIGLSIALAYAEPWVKVRWVSDGDTIVLVDGERVRYNGINAPEIAHEDQGTTAEPYGDAAKRFNIKLVKSRKVRLEFDVERRDQYGRLLAYVFLPDGKFVNAELVAGGYAYYLSGTVNKRYGQLLLRVQREAMSARRGLWRDLIENAEEYIGNRGSKRFHLKTCPFGKKIKIKNRVYFANKWDAFWAGYAPAKRCIKISELFR
ncbi:MAG: thermonuclease family protein [Deltaproteobacteria bacterium]|nr:MAG: thermonuclease family protein [Deltaproteobacteria bacterium]